MNHLCHPYTAVNHFFYIRADVLFMERNYRLFLRICDGKIEFLSQSKEAFLSNDHNNLSKNLSTIVGSQGTKLFRQNFH